MRLLGLDHIAIVVRDIDETVARAGDTVDGRADGERLRGGDIDLQFLLFGGTRLELIEVRAAGFGMPKLKDGETAVVGHLGYEVDDLEDAKAELTRRGVVLQGEIRDRRGPLDLHGAGDDVRGDPAPHGAQGPRDGRVSALATIRLRVINPEGDPCPISATVAKRLTNPRKRRLRYGSAGELVVDAALGGGQRLTAAAPA